MEGRDSRSMGLTSRTTEFGNARAALGRCISLRRPSGYNVELSRETGKPKAFGEARLYDTSYQRSRPQLRLFALEDSEWHKALKLEGYAPKRPPGPMALQEVLFSYLEALV